MIFSRRPGEGEVDEPYIQDCWRLWESIGLRKRVQTPTTNLIIDSMTRPRNMKAKTLKRHYAETTFTKYTAEITIPRSTEDPKILKKIMNYFELVTISQIFFSSASCLMTLIVPSTAIWLMRLSFSLSAANSSFETSGCLHSKI